MRRSALVAFTTVLMLVGLAVTPAQAQIGFGAGLNFNSSDDLDLSGETVGQNARATFDNATGYHIGVFMDLAFGPVAVRPGIFYRDLGTYDFDQIPGLPSESFDISLVEIPVDIRYRLPLPLVKPYILAGPVFSIPQGEGDFDDNLESMSFEATIGAGVEFSPPTMSLRIMPEIRYAFGISSYVKEDLEIAGQTFTASDEQRASALMLRLNIAF